MNKICNCGRSRRFGLIRYNKDGRQFCMKSCLNEYLKNKQQEARVRAFLKFLGKEP